MRCDFCAEPGPKWLHPARAVRFRGLQTRIAGEFGEWWACTACHRLIVAGDVAPFLARALAAFTLPGLARDLLWPQIETALRLFWETRVGSPIEVEEGTAGRGDGEHEEGEHDG